MAQSLNGVRRPPPLPGGLPLLGHAWELRRDPVGLLDRGRRQLGDTFSLRLAGARVTALIGPQANEAFFRARDDELSAREAYQFMTPVFGPGVAYDVAPEIMDEQLGFVFPALREERLQAYARFMEEEAEAYFERWGEEGQADLYTAANELTVFIASRCLIGREFRQNLSTEFARLYHHLEGGINLLALFQPHLPLPAFRRRDRARVRVGQLISGIVAARRAQGTGGEDFLEALMSARYSDGRALRDQEITGMLLSLIFAGQHTSAVLASWTGILLLPHPEMVERVRREQQEILGAGEGISLAALRRLAALECCIKEAERMHPPLIMLMRKALRPFHYGGYETPPGDLAMVSPAASHRIPEVFGDPERYDPDRFGPGREEDKKASYALIGFGGGKHRCIGLTFAYQQIKVIWSVLLRNFELQLAQPVYEPNYATFVVGPRQPCLLRYRRRREISPARRTTAPAVVQS
jgi:sterol 14-demethylase